MKNIHVLPTDKPSRFFNTNKGQYNFREHYVPDTIQTCKNHNIYITSDEEVKDGDWCYYENGDLKGVHKVVNGQRPKTIFLKKIILTTDQDLIKDGVQPIDDEFLEWFVKNPSCETVEIKNGWGLEIDIETPYYKIIIPQEEPKSHIEYTNTDDCTSMIYNQQEKEQLPTQWFKTEQIETWIGESITTEGKKIEEIKGGRGKLIVMHQCGDNKEELISQLETMIYGLKEGFEYFVGN
jgi:hypothetical protein